MKRKAARKAVQLAEQAYEVRYFARLCGLTLEETRGAWGCQSWVKFVTKHRLKT